MQQKQSLSLLEPTKAASSIDFINWNDVTGKVNGQTHYTEDDFVQPGTFFGTWIPRSDNTHLYMYAGILAAKMKADRNAAVSVCAVLDDRKDSRTDKYEQEWNGFWQFSNVMQFNDQFIAVCYTGLDNQTYSALPSGKLETAAEDVTPAEVSAEAWDEIKSMLFDDISKSIADECKARGIPAPEEAGYELADASGEVIAELELAWIEKKIGFMTEEQAADIEKAKASGWKIFTVSDEIDDTFKEV